MAALASRRRVAAPKQAAPNNNTGVAGSPEKKVHQDVMRTKQWVGYCAVTIFLLLLFVVMSPPHVTPTDSMLKLVGEQDAIEDRGLESSQSASSGAVAATSTEQCSIEHFAMDDADLASKGGKVPVIVRGWTKPKEWQEQPLMKKVGHYQQYIKDGFVQPVKDNNEELCTLPGTMIANVMKKSEKNLLFFTNNKENEQFMKDIEPDYQVPSFVSHIDGFQVFSAVAKDRSHTFHKHGESWLGQVEGRRMWWFLPPDVTAKPDRVSACEYLAGTAKPPEGAISCLQEPGDIVWFPKDWYHATCALDEWTVGIGAQQGPLIRQQFDPLDQSKKMSQDEVKAKTKECLGIDPGSDKDWTWFDGDLNAYYNSLEKDHNRNPDNIASYAVHRWMGEKHTTETHYELIHDAIGRHHSKAKSALAGFDGGCGLGSALMWMEKTSPQWKMTGHTISEEQHKFITTKLPKHNFNVNLRSYNDLDKDFDLMYSIEALIHSPNVTETMQEWAKHLNEGGVIVIIDDFISVGTDKEDPEVIEFARSWLANSLFSPTELGSIGRKFGLHVVENRDLDAEFRINELNYKNKMPNLNPDNTKKTHQGWMGSKWRQLLTLKGKVTYNMLVMQKGGAKGGKSKGKCNAVPQKKEGDKGASYTEITPQLMSGKGGGGGEKMACISGWYCCNKGTEWWENLNANRTDNTAFLKLDKELFGHYITSFAKHLNKYYEAYPDGSKGRFLDIGGTGSTASGMTQVTSKFQHFAGPLDYWILDSDIGAKDLQRTIYCDIDDCPAAETCGFDVTFSHTVLEHAKRPWESFDTIARITKKGGLTMHLVPWSYQFHATPDDNYRFSHKAVTTLLEDRGFTVLEVGYDICTKPPKMLRRVDEHYDVIWLVYVIGRKN